MIICYHDNKDDDNHDTDKIPIYTKDDDSTTGDDNKSDLRMTVIISITRMMIGIYLCVYIYIYIISTVFIVRWLISQSTTLKL